MIKTKQNTGTTENIYPNTIHLDSKWMKSLVNVTGSIESALILSECVIYYQNQYRSFNINGKPLYGLLTSAKELQRDYNLSYKRANKILKDMVSQDLLEVHQQGFIHNQRFYTPSKKALNSLNYIHINYKNQSNIYETKDEPLLPIGESTLPYRQKTYKDKNKDKKNNNHNILSKNYSMLENSKPQNVKTVIFDFKKFNLQSIYCEENILDYFTAKQNQVISTIVFCYSNTLDIVKFNQILNRQDVKKEANNFKQLVTWAYYEAVKENNNTLSENTEKTKYQPLPETQNNAQCLNKKNNSLEVNHPNNLSAAGLPDITANDIQTMIDQRHEKSKKSNNKITPKTTIKTLCEPGKKFLPMVIDTEQENAEKTDVTEKETKQPKSASSFLLSQSNRLYLIENLSAQGINDPSLILRTAQQIVDEYANLSFNDLLDGVIYRLVKLPLKQQNQTSKNQSVPVNIENNPTNMTDDLDINQQAIKKTPQVANKTTLDLLDKDNEITLIEGLNAVGISNKKIIFDTAKEILNEYPEINFTALLEGVIYRLVTLPAKLKKTDDINPLLRSTFENVFENKNPSAANIATEEVHAENGETHLPELADILMPDVKKYTLRQDWASKADQRFYDGILPDSQKLALVAMIDYVQRKGITITIEQEVYEWLYHMASNQKYYYSCAKNFKHWCNIVMRQLMQKRLHKPKGFDGWRNRIECNSLACAA